MDKMERYDKLRENIVELYEEEDEKIKKIKKILIEKEKESDMEKIKESRYIGNEKYIVWEEWEKDEELIYVVEKKDISILARYRLGSVNKTSKYWTSENEQRCRLCNKESKSLQHIFEKCETNTRKEKDLKFILSEDGRGRGFMKGITCRRDR